MYRVKEEEEVLTDKRQENEDLVLEIGKGDNNVKKKKKKTKKKKGKKSRNENEEDKDKENEGDEESNKKHIINNDQFIINDTYNLIKILGFGAFGEILLAYDTLNKELRAIKLELATQKSPQLKHEHSILQQLNTYDNDKTGPPDGIPHVYGYSKIENKCNYMIMDFLGPSLGDLFQLRNKRFSPKTVCLIAIQMLQRIEYIHEKGFIHRDIKPENFVVGLNDKSNIIYIIDFGLSKRYKDKNTGQHIPYRENRYLIGTARYASLNAHLGIEQSRRDDIESIGYVLVYFYLGRLPWQSKIEKSKQSTKIMEKKLITPPEILCKKMPIEFAYYLHYCKNLKFEDRPDYSTLKSLFYELLMKIEGNVTYFRNEFTFDWFEDKIEDEIFEENEDNNKLTSMPKLNTDNSSKENSSGNNLDNLKLNSDDRGEAKFDLFNLYENLNKDQEKNPRKRSDFTDYLNKSQSSNSHIHKEFLNEIKPKTVSRNSGKNETIILVNKKQSDEIIKISIGNEDENWSIKSSDQDDTLQDVAHQNESDIKNIIEGKFYNNLENSNSNKHDNSGSRYKLLSSSKSSKGKKSDKTINNKEEDDDIVLKTKPNKNNNSIFPK